MVRSRCVGYGDRVKARKRLGKKLKKKVESKKKMKNQRDLGSEESNGSEEKEKIVAARSYCRAS
jgi:hypothetical protein